MGRTTVKSSQGSQRRHRPATTPEARENQLISLAVDLAEEQLRNKTASSQVITHFLKLATSRAELEKERLVQENKLLQAKTEAIQSGKQSEAFYQEVIDALMLYNGKGGNHD